MRTFPLLAISFLLACSRPPAIPELPKNIDAAQLASGDIVLRAGKGWFSGGIMFMLSEPVPMSHVGILQRNNDQWEVLHTMAASEPGGINGIRAEPLASFLHQAQDGLWLISRLEALDASLFMQQALAFKKANIPFDENFDWGSPSSFYCTEYVYHCMAGAGYAPLPLPDTISNGKIGLGLRHFYSLPDARIIAAGDYVNLAE